eukprot:1332646-Amorphochlora_amoeboformis.AAC.2
MSLEKISPDVALVMDNTNLEVRIKRETMSEENAFVKIPVNSMFDDWRIESRNSNIIGLSVRASSLVAALRTGDRATKIILRLHKKEKLPYLKIEMTTENNRITQDVPIRMLNRRQIEVGEDLMLTATSSGTLTLQVTSDMVPPNLGFVMNCEHLQPGQVTIKTFYRNLKIPEGDDEKKEQEPITAQCRMNIKKISQVLKTNLVSRMSHYVVGCTLCP